MGPKNAFFKNVHFRGPNLVGGAWYGIFLIREKPALGAGLIKAFGAGVDGLSFQEQKPEELTLLEALLMPVPVPDSAGGLTDTCSQGRVPAQ